jgi:hypothetical protein
MNEIIYRQIRMPYRVAATVMEDSNGDYNIYVNDCLSGEAVQNAVTHELAHIRSGDTRSEDYFSVLEDKVE